MANNDGWEDAPSASKDGWEDAPTTDNKGKFWSADLPLGIAETLTTGLVGAVGGLGSQVYGSLKGALTPGMTASQGIDEATSAYGNSTMAKELAPQTSSGKAIEHGFGTMIEGWKNDVGLLAEKLQADGVAEGSPEWKKQMARAFAAAMSALPEASMPAALLGGAASGRVHAGEPLAPSRSASKLISELEAVDSPASPKAPNEPMAPITVDSAGVARTGREDLGLTTAVEQARQEPSSIASMVDQLIPKELPSPEISRYAPDAAMDSVAAGLDKAGMEGRSTGADSAVAARLAEQEAGVARQTHFDQEANVRGMENSAPSAAHEAAMTEARLSRETETPRPIVGEQGDMLGQPRPDLNLEMQNGLAPRPQEPTPRAMGEQLDMFGRANEKPFELTAQDGMAPSADRHPFVMAAEARLVKQEALVTKLSEQVQKGQANAGALARAVKDLENFELTAERTRSNVEKGIGGETKPVPFNFKNQGGGIDPAVFREGYKKAARALSQLTDQPWLKARFPADRFMTNGDGTPLVMLHGTTRAIEGPLKASEQGVHLGFVTSPHMFITERHPKWGKAGLFPELSRKNGQLYPTTLKKGNYPFLPFDGGDWTPTMLMRNNKFAPYIEGKLKARGYTEKDLSSFRTFLDDANNVKEANQRFTEILKRADIDGFFYKNSVESPKYHHQSRIADKMMDSGRSLVDAHVAADGQIKAAQDPTSFVTWDASRIKSVYDNTGNPSQVIKSPGGRQRGSIQLGSDKKNEAGILNNIEGIKKAIGEFVPEKATPEEIVQRAKNMPDLDQNVAQRGINMFTKGGAYMAQKTKNLVVKFTSDSVKAADQLTRADVEKWIHHKDTGLGPSMRKLSKQEQVDVWAAIDAADKNQKPLTTAMLERNGFNEKQIELVQKHREAMDYALKMINKARDAAGMEPVTSRTAYVAIRSSGDFRKLVYKLDEAGEKQVVGIVGSDSRFLMDRRAKALEKEGYVIGEERYFGSASRDHSAAQQAFAQALEFLADKHPDTKVLIDTLAEIQKQEAYNMLNMKSHTMAKKGIFGMDGRKPWESDWHNAHEGFQSQLQYLESSIKWGHMSDAALNVNKVLKDKDVKMPLAKQWSESYLQNALGYNPSGVGKSIERAVSLTMKEAGVGYNIARSTLAVTRKVINTTLLSLNPGFWLTNIVQPLAALPGLRNALVARGLRADFDFGTGYSYIVKGGAVAIREALGKSTAFDKEMLTYAKDKHVYGSDLVEHSNESNRSASFYLEKVGGIASGPIESATRKTVFYSFAALLKENGMSVKNGLFEAAQNLTDMAMNNYSATERPQIYNSLGPIGDAAVNLSSYKHNELSRISMFARMLKEEGAPTPVIAQVATTVAMAGITGSIAFAEADWVYKKITAMMGKPDSLSRVVIGMSEKVGKAFGAEGKGQYVASHGLFSLLGVDMANRLGIGNIMGDTAADILMPGVSKLATIAQKGYTAATSPSEMHTKELLTEAAPGGLAGPLDRKWFSTDTPNGELSHKHKAPYEGQVLRNTEDKLWKSLGMSGIHESVQKQKLFQEENINRVYADLRKKPLEAAAGELFTSGKVSDATVERYIKYQGDPKTLVADIINVSKNQNLSGLQREKLSAAMSKSITNLYRAQRLQGAFPNENK
jgi:hypothetical protein